MTAICETLPFELAEECENEFCYKCSLYVADKDTDGKCIYVIDNEGYCEYCYGEDQLGVDVYTCVGCGDKTYEFTDFNNTELDGCFCNNCYVDYLERKLEEGETDTEWD